MQPNELGLSHTLLVPQRRSVSFSISRWMSLKSVYIRFFVCRNMPHSSASIASTTRICLTLLQTLDQVSLAQTCRNISHTRTHARAHARPHARTHTHTHTNHERSTLPLFLSLITPIPAQRHLQHYMLAERQFQGKAGYDNSSLY